MSAFALFDATSASTDIAPQPVGVFRRSGSALGPVPGIVCESIQWYEGPRPADATLRYVIDERQAALPQSWAQLLPVAPAAPGALRQDDRVVIGALTVQGEVRWLFDGFVELPEIGLNAQSLQVPVRAVSVAKRCWDQSLGGAVYRATQDYADPTANAVTELPARFNPLGVGNCTGDDLYDAVIEDATYPVFIRHAVVAPADSVRTWSLDRAARYVLGRGNGAQTWVKHPDKAAIEQWLRAITPTEPGGTVDFSDPTSFTREEIVVPDQSVSDRPWPEALADLIGRHGFAFAFGLRQGQDGLPETFLYFYPLSDPIPVGLRDVWLQPPGQKLDLARSNLTAAAMQRDGSQIVNVWRARLARRRVEATFVLLPGFTPDPADAADEDALDQFRRTTTSPDADPVKYRSWVFSEGGDGYWDGTAFQAAGAAAVRPLAEMLRAGDFVARRRPALGARLATDALGQPLPPKLGLWRWWAAFKESDVAKPRLFPASEENAWDDVYWIKGGWRLDPEALGIIVEANDPNDWDLGGHRDVADLNGGRYRLIDTLNGTNGAERRQVALVLVAAVEDDGGQTPLGKTVVEADLTRQSPTLFRLYRTVDARDRHRIDVIDESSPDFDPGGNLFALPDRDVQVVRDDRQRAAIELRDRAAASAYPRFAGPLTLSRLANIYWVGNRVRRIVGHDMDLRLNIGAAGAAAIYPRIVRLTWRFGDRQETVLQLSDERGAEEGART